MKMAKHFVVAGLVASLLGTTLGTTQADARRFAARPHVRAHVVAHNARVVHRARVANRIYRRGRWVNGVWVAGAVATGVAVGTNTCAYYYNRWRATGSSYWRNLYYDNCG